ncbi:MalY/PatB family protein [Streptomyces sp. GQFP]|uniref:MalY/PatB family protein n=1 Tax=Streptomyces sp. GQFP TaxID=2907545 RepID=UPI001F2FAB2B|nr:aminotransferase class I/II-fold pyridoxal phosphate-dependent enzyme [Streptomyces sp. GQFP]UIX32071.1 aminotransferase class I/II-fold pyridoxal phosphate-dependent enzyme [Streptomyces sp. GQFP]
MAIKKIDVIPDFKPARLKWSEFGEEAIGAGAAEMDFGTAPVVRDAMYEAMESGVHGYLPVGIAAEVRGSSARWQWESYGWAVDPDDIRLVPDAVTALTLVVDHFTEPTMPIIVPTPVYPRFVDIARTLRRTVVPVGLTQKQGRYRYRIDEIEEAFERAGGGLLVLCNPQNPTGFVADANALLEISKVVTRHAGRVFADELHGPLVYAPRNHVPYASLSAESAQHSITVVSASKAWNLSGLKCSEVILTNPLDKERWDRSDRLRLSVNATSTLGAIAAAAAYTSGGPWLDSIRNYLRRNSAIIDDFIKSDMPEVGYRAPDATFLAWLDFSGIRGLSSDPAQYLLERARVAVLDGRTFGPGGEGFVRFNFATSRRVLVQALERMQKSVKSLPRE